MEVYEMRILLLVLLLAFPQATKEPMALPKVTHHDRATTQHYDDVEISCPDGYEGHFVDIETGFTSMDRAFGNEGFTTNSYIIGERPGYMICFEKSFMDKVRKTPDVIHQRPSPPRPA